MSSKISSFTAEREKLMEATFENYKGRLIHKINNYDYRVEGSGSAPSMEEAKKLVDASFKIKLRII